MGESLTERRRVSDEGLIGCKALSDWEEIPAVNTRRVLTVPSEEAPANSVPAAAVIRRVRALFGFTGYKGCVGGLVSQR